MSGPKSPDSHHPTTSYAGARVLINSEKLHCQADWKGMSVCPLISFPGKKSIWETQLPEGGCSENTESDLGELDYPGSIFMKVWKTNESPSCSPGIHLFKPTKPSFFRAGNCSQMPFTPSFPGKPLPIQGIYNYFKFITPLYFMHYYNEPILNSKLLFYVLDFVGWLFPWWPFMTYKFPPSTDFGPIKVAQRKLI